MEGLADVVKEGAQEDEDDTGGSEQCDGDTERDNLSNFSPCRLLCYDHVGIPDWIPELRVEALNHHPGQTQSLAHKYCVDCEVDYQDKPGRTLTLTHHYNVTPVTINVVPQPNIRIKTLLVAKTMAKEGFLNFILGPDLGLDWT